MLPPAPALSDPVVVGVDVPVGAKVLVLTPEVSVETGADSVGRTMDDPDGLTLKPVGVPVPKLKPEGKDAVDGNSVKLDIEVSGLIGVTGVGMPVPTVLVELSETDCALRKPTNSEARMVWR